MPDTDLAYETRFGWNRRTTLTVAVSLLFVVVLLLMDPGENVRVAGIDLPALAIQIPGLLLFGAGGVLMVVNALSGKVALRVDRSGILLGGSPARYAATTVTVPWQDVVGVELWIQHVGLQKLPYVGVHRRPGLPPLGGTRGGGVGTALTGKPVELINASRAVNGWRLDTAALLAAVRRHAPEADIVVDPDFPAAR
ncbi:hypothetical protein [Kitasatospora cinereorecta]|uniref:PH domain-containing protein n=1 Tax=Kitasatospora cinereorecta TaxID=285560 RepID=A0ABW0VLL9_9ACTN